MTGSTEGRPAPAIWANAMRPDGYVQDRGAAPWDRPAADRTGAQGLGAFLIAGREVALLTPGCA